MSETETNKLSAKWKHSKRRLDNSADIFEEGNIICSLATKQVPLDDENLEMDSRKSSCPDEIHCAISGCNKFFDSLASYELHYNSNHKNKCRECKRNFPSTHLLDIHLQEWHDSMFEVLAAKQPMYQCLNESCKEKFLSADERKKHMIKVHQYPSNFRFDQRKSVRKPADTQKIKDLSTSDVTSMDVTEQGRTDIKKPTLSSGRIFSYKVPKDICFGQGVSRGFMRGRGRGRGGRGGRKHWHQKDQNENTVVNIESVDMTDLSNALE